MARPNFTMEDLRAQAKDERELVRATTLLNQNKVRDVVAIGDRISATVAGSGAAEYQVVVGADLGGSCTCPQYRRTKRRFCKHMAAIAMLWLQGDVDGFVPEEVVDPELTEALAEMEAGELREILFAAAGLDRKIRERILTGEWEVA